MYEIFLLIMVVLKFFGRCRRAMRNSATCKGSSICCVSVRCAPRCFRRCRSSSTRSGTRRPKPISQYVVEEVAPGDGVQSDDEWHSYLKDNSLGIYHPAGTCKMGKDPLAVVDEHLRVRGIDNLYVADASIMPFVVSANLNANCLMIGEKAFDLISNNS